MPCNQLHISIFVHSSLCLSRARAKAHWELRDPNVTAVKKLRCVRIDSDTTILRVWGEINIWIKAVAIFGTEDKQVVLARGKRIIFKPKLCMKIFLQKWKRKIWNYSFYFVLPKSRKFLLQTNNFKPVVSLACGVVVCFVKYMYKHSWVLYKFIGIQLFVLHLSLGTC